MAHIPCGSFKRSDGAAVLLTEEYYIGKFEVTQSQWMAVMPNNPSFFQGETLPVERISWYDAKNFCVKLNEMCAKQLPAGFSFDLPTEAQWEFACRAGTITEFSFGNTPESEKMNVNGNSGQQTVPAGLSGYKNAFGLYDMHGNVSEWCRDWYDSYGNTTTDPAGPLYGSYRVCRGGSWFDRSEKARSSARTFDLPQNRNNSRGLRIALVKKSKNTNSGVSSSQQPKDTGTGIPVLKDIPIIGRIFSVDSK